MISNCPECPLSGRAEIAYRGNKEADIVIIGESPGKTELERGIMLIGPSGEMTDAELMRVGIDPNSIFFMNAARCLIPKDDLSSGKVNQVLNCCRTYVKTALEAIKPKLIICLGALAFQTIHKKATLKNARNQFYWSEEFQAYVVVTYHPGYIMRNPQQKPVLQADFNSIARFIKNGYKYADSIECKEVSSIRPLLEGNCHKEGNYFVTAVDTETTGVNWEDPNCICISYQVAKSPTEGWTIILHEEVEKDKGDFNIFVQRGGTKKDPIYEEVGIKRAENYDQKIEELRELLSREDFKIYYMNANFEKHQFYNLGIYDVNITMDVKVGAHVLDSELYRDASLENLVTQFTDLNTNLKGIITQAEKEDMIGLLKNDKQKFILYSSADPCYTLQVGQAVKRELIKDELSLNYFVNFAQPVESELIFEMERNGVKIDTDKLPKIKKQISEEMEDITLEFKNKCPKAVVERHDKNFRLTRDIIIKEALFEWKDGKLKKSQKEPVHHNFGFNLKPIVWNKKSGQPGTDKKQVMKPILEGRYTQKIKDLVETYQRWSELNKLLTNYINKFGKMVTAEGRLHPSISITFTSSGRTGMKSPPLQTIPKRSQSAKYIRELITAPDGFWLNENDYRVSELRWVGHVANDKKMIDIFNKGQDPHKLVGLKIRGLPEDYEFEDPKEMKDLRFHSKAVNFGFIYGMQPKTFVRYADQDFGIKFTQKQGEEFRNMFFNMFREIPLWHKKDTELLKRQGYLRTCFGRKRILPKIYSDEEYARAEATRTALNCQIQGPSSDGTLLGGLMLLRDKRMDRNECRMVLFVHDALFFEIKKGKEQYYLPIIKEYMENLPTEKFGFTLRLPLEIESEIGENAANMKEINVLTDDS